MMKTWISRFACVAVLSVTTLAFATTITGTLDLPGVDVAGNLDPALGAPVAVKLNINTKKGKFTGQGAGTVTNLSGSKQVYKNPADVFPGVPGLTKTKYAVSTTGQCKLSVSGVIIAP